MDSILIKHLNCSTKVALFFQFYKIGPLGDRFSFSRLLLQQYKYEFKNNNENLPKAYKTMRKIYKTSK